MVDNPKKDDKKQKLLKREIESLRAFYYAINLTFFFSKVKT